MADLPSDIVFERCFYIGNLLQSFMYGITVYLAWSSISALRSNTVPLSRGQTKRGRQFLIIYVIAITISMTFALATNGLAGQMMWIEHRDVEGGPYVYFISTASDWENVLGTSMDMFGNFLGDLLLLYRCYVIWNSNRWVMILPILTFLASTSMAIVSAVQSALPGSSFFATQTLSFGIPWIILTCALNVMLTILISIKLLWARRRMNRLIKNTELTDVYTGVVAILVESALPFSILGIIFAILLAKQNSVYAIFSAVWGAYVGVAPLLIINRVANGKAWTRNTAHQLSTNATTASFTFGHPGGTSMSMSTLRSPSSGVHSTVTVEKKYDLAKSMTSNSEQDHV